MFVVPIRLLCRLYFKYIALSLANMKNSTAQIESNYDQVTDSFDNMDLKSELLRGVFQCRRCPPVGRIELTQYRCLCVRFRAPVCYPAARHHASHQRYAQARSVICLLF